MGLPYLSLLDVLEEAEEKPDILKLGFVHPLPEERIAGFLREHTEVKILEELDDIVERQVKALACERGLSTRLIGKLDLDDWVGEYTPDKVAETLRKTWPDLLPAPRRRSEPQFDVAPRPPQMCPGCGHRAAFHAIKQALEPTDITVADIGCHNARLPAPLRGGRDADLHGAFQRHGRRPDPSSTTAGGSSPFLGDSTFFHAGLPGIVNAIFNEHNHTLIIMENGTTAMTGHQDHPASGRNVAGPTNRIPIRQVLEGLGVTQIWETDTYRMETLTEMVREALEQDGFKVIIARHPCMLKFTRESRRKGRAGPPPVEITAACDQLHRLHQRVRLPQLPVGAGWLGMGAGRPVHRRWVV